MQYATFKCNSQKEYLGFCEQKGFIYSVQLNARTYAVIALRHGYITTLITYTVQNVAVPT